MIQPTNQQGHGHVLSLALRPGNSQTIRIVLQAGKLNLLTPPWAAFSLALPQQILCIFLRADYYTKNRCAAAHHEA